MNLINKKLKIRKLLNKRNEMIKTYFRMSWLWALSSHNKLQRYEIEIDELTKQLNYLGVYEFEYDFKKDDNGNYLMV